MTLSYSTPAMAHPAFGRGGADPRLPGGRTGAVRRASVTFVTFGPRA